MAAAASAIVAAELVSRPEDIPPAHELEAALGLLRVLEAETASFLGIAGASVTHGVVSTAKHEGGETGDKRLELCSNLLLVWLEAGTVLRGHLTGTGL
jgi:hypothetical protein